MQDELDMQLIVIRACLCTVAKMTPGQRGGIFNCMRLLTRATLDTSARASSHASSTLLTPLLELSGRFTSNTLFRWLLEDIIILIFFRKPDDRSSFQQQGLSESCLSETMGINKPFVRVLVFSFMAKIDANSSIGTLASQLSFGPMFALA
jgi:hypothetical protein